MCQRNPRGQSDFFGKQTFLSPTFWASFHFGSHIFRAPILVYKFKKIYMSLLTQKKKKKNTELIPKKKNT